MLLYMECAVLHHKLLKQGLFNLSVNWPHFQKRSSLYDDRRVCCTIYTLSPSPSARPGIRQLRSVPYCSAPR